ncbi:UNVERIFIED_CONTAM: Anthocyanidin 3-O-glucosyltransferase 6 [Sesamum angustifolium]|uniref:Anthocyanidin 3-O-glucosyltransferase 6 n=1 Tax=Sesamum angustifolium TaxID=2727405 RepID=A0AAW2KZW6_9LAMI
MLCTTMIDVAVELGVPSYVFFTSPASFLGAMLHCQTLHDEKDQDVAELRNAESEVPVPSFAKPIPPEVLYLVLVDRFSGARVLREPGEFARRPSARAGNWTGEEWKPFSLVPPPTITKGQTSKFPELVHQIRRRLAGGIPRKDGQNGEGRGVGTPAGRAVASSSGGIRLALRMELGAGEPVVRGADCDVASACRAADERLPAGEGVGVGGGDYTELSREERGWAVVAAGEIERGVREVMESGSEVRKRVKEVREKSRMSVVEGGSSYLSFKKLIHHFISNI